MKTTLLDEVRAERDRQDAKWGEQNHDPIEWVGILGEEFGEVSKAAIEAHFAGSPLSDYREELIQLAAVALGAAESLDRTLSVTRDGETIHGGGA